MRSSRVTMFAATVMIAAAQTGCVLNDDPPEDAVVGGIRSFDGDAVRFDFGAGELRTTGNDSWDGRDAIVYPGSVDAGPEPVEVEVQGLDLSAIRYTGDMGWPPDATDRGALVTISLVGSPTISYRVFSSVAGLLDPVREQDGSADPANFRSYQFQGYAGDAGPYGSHSLNLEEWGPSESRDARNTIDFRLRYADGRVAAWVRLHESGEWEAGDREAGRSCPWNVAINNALPGTADSVWTGECRTVRGGETGRAVGAWVPVGQGEWQATPSTGPARVSVAISNWENADGPYPVRWENVVLRGSRQMGGPSSSGGGRLRAFGPGGSDLVPRGEWAELSYDAVASGVDRSAEAFLRFRASGIDLTSDMTHWVRIGANEVSFAGDGRVNGEGGYRYELRGVSAEEEPDRVSLRVWGPMPGPTPFYAVFGALTEGGIEVWSEVPVTPRADSAL